MNTKRHVLIIPSWYPQTANDVNGSFFREQAIALFKGNNKVGIIKPEFRSVKSFNAIFTKPYGLRFENDEGVNTYRYHTLNVYPRMPVLSFKRWVDVGEKLYMEYVKKHGKPDIIHVHSMLPAAFLADRIKNKYGVPFIITEHSSSFARELIPKKIIEMLRLPVGNSSFRIAVSDRLSLLLTEKFTGSTWKYVPNLVSDKFFNHVEVSECRKDFIFCSVNYLTNNKRVDLQIKSFFHAFKGDKKVFLNIVGDGAQKKELMKLVKNLGVESQVNFLGHLSRESVLNEMACSDAIVLSSEYETFGVVLVEALALGKPVIATKCGGPESIVIPDVGYLVEVNSEEKLSWAMNDMKNNIDRFDPKGIISYCKVNFSEVSVVNKLNNIYNLVLCEIES